MLVNYSKTLINYFLPLLQYYQYFMDSNLLITIKLSYSTTKEGRFFIKLYSQLNSNQFTYFTTITVAIDTDPQTAYFFYKALRALVKPFFTTVFAITTVSVAILSSIQPLLVLLPFYYLVAKLPTPIFAFLLIYIRNLYVVYLKTLSQYSCCTLPPL